VEDCIAVNETRRKNRNSQLFTSFGFVNTGNENAKGKNRNGRYILILSRKKDLSPE
jgi:hypothetical protein